jgi:hypothetical protein
VLRLLLAKAGPSSLAPFLPAPDLQFPSVLHLLSDTSKPHLPARSRFEEIDYSMEGIAQEANQATHSRLEFVTGILNRYQYAVANTSASL